MVQLVLIRHGPTAWNRDGLVQGRTDVPLSDEGRAEVGRWRLPDALAGPRDWYASPLARAAETAAILGVAARTEPRLAEMDWGPWEGRTLADLRAELGDLMAAWEARGLDFSAPGGESPRDVQARVLPFLGEVAAAGRPAGAVCHRGVIRAVLAMATGWDMTGKPPAKLRDGCAQVFRLERDGTPRVEALEVPMTTASSGLSA
jgi:broad specificity phosphatase PhoE